MNILSTAVFLAALTTISMMPMPQGAHGSSTGGGRPDQDSITTAIRILREGLTILRKVSVSKSCSLLNSPSGSGRCSLHQYFCGIKFHYGMYYYYYGINFILFTQEPVEKSRLFPTVEFLCKVLENFTVEDKGTGNDSDAGDVLHNPTNFTEYEDYNSSSANEPSHDACPLVSQSIGIRETLGVN